MGYLGSVCGGSSGFLEFSLNIFFSSISSVSFM